MKKISMSGESSRLLIFDHVLMSLQTPSLSYDTRFNDTRTRSKIRNRDLLPDIEILFIFLKNVSL